MSAPIRSSSPDASLQGGWHGLVAMLLVVIPLLASESFAAGLTVRIRQIRTADKGVADAAISISSPVPLGAFTLRASFDPAALELVGVQGGSGDFAAAPIVDPASFSSGEVLFSSFQPHRMDGPTGRCHVATLRFRALTQRAMRRVKVEVVTLADTEGTTYEASARRKTIRVRPR